MLGAARASEYAGWWNTGLGTVDFSSTSVLGTEIYQTPTYSWLSNSSTGAIDGISTGSIDLTGITSLTGYNNLRSARVTHFYFPSSVWTSAAATAVAGSAGCDLYDTTTQLPFQTQVGLDTAGAVKNLRINCLFLSFNNQVAATLPGAHTQYLDTWISAVSSTAETSTVFADWAGGAQGTNTQACRVAVYNTATGALIVKRDEWRNSTTSSPAWPTLSTITNPLPLESGAAWYVNYDISASPGYDTRIGGNWFGLGTTFDPLAETNTSWRTAMPAELIGNAQSWMNVQFSRYSNVGGTTFSGTASNQDLYSQASNNQIRFNQVGSQAQFDANYSDTIIIKDSS
jgi:hypothetical protein